MDPTEAQKTLKIIFSDKLKSLSLRDFEAWRNSRAGLSLVCEAFEYDLRYCAREAGALKALELKEREEKWAECCELAWGWDWSTKKAKRKLGSIEHLREAEAVMCKALLPPPHFNRVGVCRQCGFVLVSPSVTTCPWCPSLQPVLKEIGHRSSPEVLALAGLTPQLLDSDYSPRLSPLLETSEHLEE